MFWFPTTFHLLAGLGHFFAPWREEDKGGGKRGSGRRKGRVGQRWKREVRREEGGRGEEGGRREK